METENSNVLKEQEEEGDVMECPYKNFKLHNSDEFIESNEFIESADFVINFENPKGNSSNGDDCRTRPDKLQEGASEIEAMDETADGDVEGVEGGSANGGSDSDHGEDLNMPTEQEEEEEDEEGGVMECPYKEIRLDSDEFIESADFLTNFENPKGNSSNGDYCRTRDDHIQNGAPEIDAMDETADGDVESGSENGGSDADDGECSNSLREEEEDGVMECPYKRFKLDSDEVIDTADFLIESADFVINFENPKGNSSNGDDCRAQPDQLQYGAPEIDPMDETADGDIEGGSENGGSDSDNGTESDDNYEEIETLLDQALPDDFKNKKKDYEERFKLIMEEKGRNHFEVLPEGWVQATHDSGMPLYLHRHSRVCSLSRPYFLGPGSVRKHEIPISAIPCLNYQKALEKEKELIEQQKLLKEQQEKEEAIMVAEEEQIFSNDVSNGLSTMLNLNKANTSTSTKAHLPMIPNAKVETVAENLKAHSLTHAQFTEYCKKRFNFKTIRVMRFKSWSARRKFTKNRKHIKHLQRPTLPEGTKLITFPVLSGEVHDPNSSTTTHQRPKKEWVMNPNGKSFVCILHEYVQHAWKKQPSYEFKELENSATPYLATVSINNLMYGTGYGTSKKQAKSEAARETLEVLIPEMREKISGIENLQGSSAASAVINKAQSQDLSVFDEIRIDDPRVSEFCSRVSEPLPHSILLTCLQRNYGLGNIQVKYEVNTVKHKKNEFTMTVGSHTAKAYCKNKRDGKQRASQLILQILHPHITTWGSLLRLYGNRSVKSFKEKKQEEQEITVLQNQAAVNQPNYAILNKLKSEMVKLKDLKNDDQSISRFTEVPSLLSSNITISNLS